MLSGVPSAARVIFWMQAQPLSLPRVPGTVLGNTAHSQFQAGANERGVVTSRAIFPERENSKIRLQGARGKVGLGILKARLRLSPRSGRRLHSDLVLYRCEKYALTCLSHITFAMNGGFSLAERCSSPELSFPEAPLWCCLLAALHQALSCRN